MVDELESAIKAAAQILCNGGLVAYPTEAVYGLGCDPTNEDAVQRLLEVKHRPPEKGLILIAARFAQLEGYLAPLEEGALRRIMKTWPGPVTWIIPARPEVSPMIRGQHDTLAVRVTAHPVAARLCERAGRAIVSTSANRAGERPARSCAEVKARFGDTIDFILDGPVGHAAAPTEIRHALTHEILRAGG